MAGNIGAGMYERKVRRVRFRKGDGVSVKDAAAVGDVGVLLDAGVNEVRGAYTMDEIYRFVEAYIRTMDKGLAWRAMRVRVNSGGDDAGAERMGALVLGDPRVSAAMEKLGKAVAISKARLNVLLGEEIERAAGAGELAGAKNLIDIVCKMNGYYEASKVEVKHGALDDENRARALGALREAGDVVEGEVKEVPLLE